MVISYSKINNFSSYSVDFYTKNTEYILFQGTNTTIYLYEEDTKYMLFIGSESGHEIYSADIQDQISVKFSFDQEFKINDIPMKMESKFGVVNTQIISLKRFLAQLVKYMLQFQTKVLEIFKYV